MAAYENRLTLPETKELLAQARALFGRNYQKRVSDITGLHIQTIYRWNRGETRMPKWAARMVCESVREAAKGFV